MMLNIPVLKDVCVCGPREHAPNPGPCCPLRGVSHFLRRACVTTDCVGGFVVATAAQTSAMQRCSCSRAPRLSLFDSGKHTQILSLQKETKSDK